MEKKRKSILDKVEKKDLIYLFLAIDLILILIAVVVWKYSDAQLLVDQISFGSSIASIILAVVAMIYAFFQTQEASSHSAIVQETLYKISSQVDELNAIKNELSSFRLEQVAMKEQVISIANTLGDISLQTDIPDLTKKELKQAQEKLKSVIEKERWARTKSGSEQLGLRIREFAEVIGDRKGISVDEYEDGIRNFLKDHYGIDSIQSSLIRR